MQLLHLFLLLLVSGTLPTVSSSFRRNSTLWENANMTSSSWNSSAVYNAMYNSSFDDDNGTTAAFTTAEPSVTSFWQYHAMVSWFTNAPPILIVLATVGNTFSIITLQNPTFQKLHSSGLTNYTMGATSDKILQLGF